ncbi:MAG: hypothetical protein AAF702_36085 [Chloroflexota bacterium]
MKKLVLLASFHCIFTFFLYTSLQISTLQHSTLQHSTLQNSTLQNSINEIWPVSLIPSVAAAESSGKENLLLESQDTSADHFAAAALSTVQNNSSFKSATNEHATNDIGPDILDNPQLAISLGIVAINNRRGRIVPSIPDAVFFNTPGSVPSWTGEINSRIISTAPIESNVFDLDGDDLVTVAMVIENQGTGSNGVFDIRLGISIPDELLEPTLPSGHNIQARTGAGALIDAEEAPSGLFSSGITLRKLMGGGAVLSEFDQDSGSNIAVVTFDLAIKQSVTPSTTLPITLTLNGYSFINSGNDTVIEIPLTTNQDRAFMNIRAPELRSIPLATSQVHTSNVLTEPIPMAIGEIITHAVTLEIPEGLTPEAFFVSQLDPGYGFVGISSITASTNITTAIPGGFEAVREMANVVDRCDADFADQTCESAQRQAVELDFDTLAVRNDGLDGPGTIEIRYQIVVLNNQVNRQDESPLMRAQSLQLFWDSNRFTITGQTSNTFIEEPVLQISQVISPAQPNIGDIVTVTLSVSHAANSKINAFDLLVADNIPEGLIYVPDSLEWRAGPTPSILKTSELLIEAEWAALELDQKGSIRFQAIVTDSHVSPSQSVQNITIVNEAIAQWSSLPGKQNQSLSAYHELAAERTGNINQVGGIENRYQSQVSSSIQLTITASAPPQVWLQAELTGENLSRSDGPVQPGDTVQYRLTIWNRGHSIATGVYLRNWLDNSVELDSESIQTNQAQIQRQIQRQLRNNAEQPHHVILPIGSIDSHQPITITYKITVQDRLADGVTQIANQALLYGDNFTLVVSDDPATQRQNDPTILPTTDGPRLFATNQVFLDADLDSNGIASTGDMVAYEIKIANHGTLSAEEVMLSAQMPPEVTLDPESIESTEGTIVEGERAGDSRIEINISQIEPGTTATVRFRASVNELRSNLIKEIQNQAIVMALNHPAILTDDPTTLQIDDPTVMPLTDTPLILATQSQYLLEDADGDGVPSAGDTMAHLISIRNHGTMTATDIIVTNGISRSASLIEDSLRVSPNGTSSAEMEQSLDVEIAKLSRNGSFGGTDRGTISYLVAISETIPVSVSLLSAQSTIAGTGFPTEITGDPYHLVRQSRTSTVISRTAHLHIWKKDLLLRDLNQDSAFSPPGEEPLRDRLLYWLLIENVGTISVTQVIIEDNLNANIKLIPSTLRSNRGETILGDTDDSTSVLIDLGALPEQQYPGSSEKAIVSFEVELVGEIPPEQIENMATLLVSLEGSGVNGNSQYTLPSDDPDTVKPNDVTITRVLLAPTQLVEVEEPGPRDTTPTVWLPLIAWE